MRLLGYIVAASIALALLQAAVQVAALILAVGALAAFIQRPRETIALVTTLGVLNLVALYPLPSVAIVGGIAAANGLSRWRARAPRYNASSESVRRITRQAQSRGD